jgi:hypothetical protein
LVLPDRQFFLCRVHQVTARGKSLAAVSSADCRDQSGVSHGQRSYAMENRNSDDVVSGCDFSGDFCEDGCGSWVALVIQTGHSSPVIVIAYVTGKHDVSAGAWAGDGEPNLIDGDRALHDVTEQNFGHHSIIGYNLAIHTAEA